jgi:hypothetical protein
VAVDVVVRWQGMAAAVVAVNPHQRPKEARITLAEHFGVPARQHTDVEVEEDVFSEFEGGGGGSAPLTRRHPWFKHA